MGWLMMWRKVMANKVEAMRAGGRILAEILQALRERVVVGVNELALDAWVADEILRRGAEVAYWEKDINFPGAICISVNDELIHGVPEDNVLVRGDKVSFDLTIKYRGYYVDSAFSMVVDGGGGALGHLLGCTESAMWEGIEVVRDGARIGDIGFAVEKTLVRGKLGVVRNYVGHGIGEKMHMKPDVPNFGRRGVGEVLRAGDTICIEPMSSLGKADTVVGDDGWTVRLRDGSMGAHFEHTVLVTDNGYEVLTKWEH
jgi:methionyl aminopeptidase